jgi:predicted GH43/DUF377 family glycosyl hydrolase
VLKVGSVYHQYYTYLVNGQEVIGHATSSDGVNWVKDVAHNPVLSHGASGQWDSVDVWSPMVWVEGNTWYMTYTAWNGTVSAIGLATSSDGVSWVKSASNPVLRSSGGWEGTSIEGYGIMKVDSTYYLWYNSFYYGPRRTGLATSTDLIHWVKDANNPIFNDSGVTETFCAFPFQYEGYYYLLAPRKPWNSADYTVIELYRDTSPTMYAGSRQDLGVAISYSGGNNFDSNDLDTPFVLTDNVNRNSFSLTNNNLWCYYGGQNASVQWATGLTIEKVSDVLSGNSYANIWIKEPEDLSSQSRTIYVYYGNNQATTTSNGDSTFLLFDDFNAGVLNTTKWTQYGSGSVTQSGGTVTITASANAVMGLASNTALDLTQLAKLDTEVQMEITEHY